MELHPVRLAIWAVLLATGLPFPWMASRAVASEPDVRDAMDKSTFWTEVAELAKLSGTDEPAPAVCWLNEGATNIRHDGGEFKIGNFSTYEFRRIQIVVLDAKRAEEYANIAIACSKSVTVSNIKARTITKKNKVIAVKGGDIHERSRFPDYVLYADVKEKVFTMPSFADSCVIEYEFARSVGGLQFEDEFRFDMGIPVRKAVYVFGMPSEFPAYGLDVTTRTYGAPGSPVKGTGLTAEGELTTLTWICKDMPAIVFEPLMPPSADVCSRVAVALGRLMPDFPQYTWQVMGDMYYESVIAPLLTLSTLPREAAQRWLQDPQGELGNIEQIANAVAENVRYLAIELEGAGWTPNEPQKVLSERYGDCKDMSMLTVALLRSLGIEAWPALLRTRDVGALDGTIVTPSLMNHMIVNVQSGGKEYWVDPTGGVLKLGELPSSDRGALTLIVKSDECEFGRVPEAAASDNRQKSSIAARIGPDGTVTGELRLSFAGDLALEMRNVLRTESKDDIRKYFEHVVGNQFPGARVDTWEQGTPADDEGCCVSMSFEAERAVSLTGDRVVLDGTLFGNAGPDESLTSGERHHSVVFRRPYTVTETCSIALPAGWVVDSLPGDVDIPSKFGRYSRSFQESGAVIESTRTFELHAKSVSATEYTELRTFWLDVGRAEKDPVLLVQG